MYLQSIHLTNIKSFRDARLELPSEGGYAGWNVILGGNASGKTTLLQAIALCLLGPGQVERLLDVVVWPTEGEALGHCLAVVGTGRTERILGFPVATGTFNVDLTLVRSPTKIGDRDRAPGEVVFTGDDQHQIFAAFGLYSRDSGWFSSGYGAFRRLSGASGDTVDPKSRAARHLTLFREDAALTDCEAWLTSLYGQSIDPENPARDEAARQLTGARAALNRLLPDEVRLVKLTSQGAIFGQARTSLNVGLRQLSDGYRSFLAMVIDLLRHTLQAGASVDEAGVVDCEGVVLIDEVDAHLHPRWQREIGPQLCAAFPKLQFIVSTHSPFVAQTAREGGLFRLVQTEAGATIEPFPERVLGRRVEQLLTSPLFGLDSSLDAETEALVARRAALEARRPRSAEDEAELESVIHKLEDRDGAPGPTWAEMKRQEQLEAELEALLRHGDGR